VIIEAEVDESPVNLTWPTEEEMNGMIDGVIQNTGTPDAPPGIPTVAERVKEVIDPWQSLQNDPWLHVKTDTEVRRDEHHSHDHDGHRDRGFRLVSEKDINLTKLHGEQDTNNKIPYMKWAKRIKEFTESNGKEGIELVKAMEWGVSMGRLMSITDDMVKQRFPVEMTEHQDKQLMLLMKNWTAGMAEEAITYNVKNGVDAWRKLYYNQLLEIEHQKTLLMNEFNALVKTTTIADMKVKIQSIERITALWTEKSRSNIRCKCQSIQAQDNHSNHPVPIHCH
jgi:hypothetical protein